MSILGGDIILAGLNVAGISSDGWARRMLICSMCTLQQASSLQQRGRRPMDEVKYTD
jgi:hypothetical protein